MVGIPADPEVETLSGNRLRSYAATSAFIDLPHHACSSPVNGARSRRRNCRRACMLTGVLAEAQTEPTFPSSKMDTNRPKSKHRRTGGASRTTQPTPPPLPPPHSRHTSTWAPPCGGQIWNVLTLVERQAGHSHPLGITPLGRGRVLDLPGAPVLSRSRRQKWCHGDAGWLDPRHA